MLRLLSLALLVFSAIQCGRPSTWVPFSKFIEPVQKNIDEKELSSIIQLTVGSNLYISNSNLNSLYGVDSSSLKSSYTLNSSDPEVLEITLTYSYEEHKEFELRCLKAGEVTINVGITLTDSDDPDEFEKLTDSDKITCSKFPTF